MNEVTMQARYAMMIIAGMLAQRGYIDSSLEEPIIGLGVVVIAYGWKKLEDYFKSKKAEKVVDV